jgi:hypothetical protein
MLVHHDEGAGETVAGSKTHAGRAHVFVIIVKI